MIEPCSCSVSGAASVVTNWHAYETVRNLGFAIDGGHNGFTALRHDLSYEEAISMLRTT